LFNTQKNHNVTNQIHSDGEVIVITAGATIASGEVVKVGDLIGVAVVGGASGDSVALNLEGVYEVPKKSADAIAQGVACYWDDSNKQITTTASSHTFAGYAFAAAGSGVTTIQLLLK